MTEKKYKICSKCKQEKLLRDFYKDTTEKFGVRSQCKKCVKEYQAKYRRENPEKVKESLAKYRQENPEKIKERDAKYRRENSEKVKECKAKYYQKNSDKVKECAAKYRRENSEKVKESLAKYRRENSEKVKECKAKYRRENSEKLKERAAKYYQKNSKKLKERAAKYRRENSEKIKERKAKYQNKRYKNDENFRITSILRARLSQALKSQSAKKSKSAQELVGCSRDELWEHLEKQFKDGMIRQNLGKWHVDHIKPCSLFDLTDPEQQKECFNYKNLQPLWAEENLRKGAKW